MTVIKRRRIQRGSLCITKTGWWLRYRGADGKEQRQFVGTKSQLRTKAAARLACDRFMAELNPEHQLTARSVTLKAFAPVYEQHSIGLMKPASAASARSLLHKHIVPFFGRIHLDAVGLQLQQQFITNLHAQGLSNKTISNCLVILARLTSLARKYGHPAIRFERDALKLPPDELDHTRRFFTPAETRQILDAARTPWLVLYALYAYLGIRAGEGLGLCWSHINFTHKVIHIRQAAVMGRIQTTKSRNSKADLPMPEALADTLVSYQREWIPNDAGLLFANEHGQPLIADHVRAQHFAPLLRQLGIPHGGLHAFRHALTTNLLEAGVPIHTVKALLRHGDIRTSLSYSHSVVEDQRRATDKGSAVISGESRNDHV